MALKTFVKISTVNNLSDARYCAGMEVDLIGFNLESSNSNYISPEDFNELTDWLSGVKFVGEFENARNQEILETVEAYAINYLQISDPTQLQFAKGLNLPVILKVPLDKTQDLPKEADPDYLLITGDGNELSPEKVRKVRDLTSRYNILLGAGITDENVEFLINETGAKGIALQGGDELRPGYKDYDELADILEALEIED